MNKFLTLLKVMTVVFSGKYNRLVFVRCWFESIPKRLLNFNTYKRKRKKEFHSFVTFTRAQSYKDIFAQIYTTPIF